MGFETFGFIQIGFSVILFLFFWIIYYRLKKLTTKFRDLNEQLKEMIMSLEKKIIEQEVDVGEVKEDFKSIQNKIIELNPVNELNFL